MKNITATEIEERYKNMKPLSAPLLTEVASIIEDLQLRIERLENEDNKNTKI